MRLVTFVPDHPARIVDTARPRRIRDQGRVGVLLDEDSLVLDLAAAVGDPAEWAFDDMRALIDSGERGLDLARALCDVRPEHALVDRGSVRLRSPLPRPARMRDCGLFVDHMPAALRELARRHAAAADDPEAEFERLMASGRFDLHPLFYERVLYYTADRLAVSGPEDEIHAPPGARQLDYELEFAAVIARTGRNLDADSAREHIFGYTIFNDWSARDLQIRLMQTGVGPGEGKDFEGSTTLGPCIVTRDELPDPYSLTMTATVNGEEWSRGGTDGMRHTFEDAIVQFGHGNTVHAGEVIGSGTVPTGTGFDLGRALSDGDVVELAVEGIGILRNRVRIDAPTAENGARP